MTEEEFLTSTERLRDPASWEKGEDGAWRVTDNHVYDPGVEAARLILKGNVCPFIRTPDQSGPRYQTDGVQTEFVVQKCLTL